MVQHSIFHALGWVGGSPKTFSYLGLFTVYMCDWILPETGKGKDQQ